MRKILFIICLSLNLTFLQAGIPTTNVEYRGPTEMLIARETRDQIEHILITERKIPSELFPFFDAIATDENWGHIGYHGANHGFRFYQDVIKFTIEEILGIPIREDFHFLRIPGDNDLDLNSVDEFVSYWEKKGAVDNKDKIRAKQLLSMNYAIYSNFDIAGSCSVGLFAHDKSSADLDYVEELKPFFKKVGISKSTNHLKKLKIIFDAYLTEKSGILLQVSEDSHLTDRKKEAYNFADKQLYPAIRGGIPYDNQLVSVHYKTAMSEDYINKVANISDQLRLVINNQNTLNPNSHLKIKRWDLQDPEKIALYEKTMKAAIRNLKYDKRKMTSYHDLLERTWKGVKK